MLIVTLQTLGQREISWVCTGVSVAFNTGVGNGVGPTYVNVGEGNAKTSTTLGVGRGMSISLVGVGSGKGVLKITPIREF